MYSYDKDLIKNSLTVEQMMSILEELGGEPRTYNGEIIISRTICHNPFGTGSHKLYFYMNTKLFKCYTDCGGQTWDIFELVRKVKTRETNREWNLPQAVEYVAQYFGFIPTLEVNDTEKLKDWDILDRYKKTKSIEDIKKDNNTIILKEYDSAILKNLPHPHILPWIQDNINEDIMESHGICYDPKAQGIVIPHYDINNRLIGIRERALVDEIAKKYGKYRPAKLDGKMYNHPLGWNLYNINNAKDNIINAKRAIVLEGEKSTLQYASYFGKENDISVAICGSSFIEYQAWMLIKLGVREIIVGLDKQYKEPGDAEFNKLIHNLKQINNKYGSYVTISYLFDKENLLGYKESPTDEGKDVFLELFKRRVNLY